MTSQPPDQSRCAAATTEQENWSGASVGHVSPPQPFQVTHKSGITRYRGVSSIAKKPRRRNTRSQSGTSKSTLVSAINARFPRARKRI